jgi:hypothetical protein
VAPARPGRMPQIRQSPLGLMLASDAAPFFSLDTRLGTCHPISRRRPAREPIVLSHEGGSSTATAMDSG